MRSIVILGGLVLTVVGASGCNSSLATPATSRTSGDGEVIASGSGSLNSIDESFVGNGAGRLAGFDFDYSKWTLVKDDTSVDTSDVGDACLPFSNAISNAPIPSPHLAYALKVFANPAAEVGLGTRDARPLPVGSVIVKEKWTHGENRFLAGVGAMIKREPGYDPEHGDWEYVYETKGSERSVVRGRLENCRSCHSKASSLDYVFLSSRDDLLEPDPDRDNPIGL